LALIVSDEAPTEVFPKVLELDGGGAAAWITPVCDEVAVPDPAALDAVTARRIVDPASAATGV
jgi:hypothetical protein